GTNRMNTRRRERDQPPDVVGSYEMPRGPHEVGAKNFSIVERFLNDGVSDSWETQADRPSRHRIFLGLHRYEPGHDLLPACESCAGKMLIDQPLVDNVTRRHAGGIIFFLKKIS